MPKANYEEFPTLSDVQLEVMNTFCERTECSVADVWRVLNERRGVTRNTGVLHSPTVSQASTQQQCVRRLIDTVFDGCAEGLVLTLLNMALTCKTVTTNE